MKLRLLAVAERPPAWAEAAVTEYAKRMPREFGLELVSVRPEKRAGQNVASIQAAEAARVREKCPRGARLVCLDERGRQPTTHELVATLRDWQADARDVVLVIGGADGLAPDLIADADAVLALSRLTLPHALARVVLVEQLYRAAMILAGHPYHRD